MELKRIAFSTLVNAPAEGMSESAVGMDALAEGRRESAEGSGRGYVLDCVETVLPHRDPQKRALNILGGEPPRHRRLLRGLAGRGAAVQLTTAQRREVLFMRSRAGDWGLCVGCVLG